MSPSWNPSRRRLSPILAMAILAAGAAPPLAAQEAEQLPGIRLGLAYEAAYVPSLAIEPFMGRFGGQGVSGEVEAIVGRDLGYSDRFEMLDSLPDAMARETVDYSLWDRLGADWLLRGRVEGSGSGFVLLLELHDVVYSQVKERGTFRLPDRASYDEFRMAVHRASDQVVQWAFGEPGMAASRIAFSMVRDGVKEIYVIDSDGENLRRVTNHDDIALSPSWSPDGSKLAYMTYDGQSRIYEVDLATGRSQPVTPLRDGNYMTPAYLPDGESIAFGVHGGSRSGLFTYNTARECCLTNLSEGNWEDLGPSYSPDGGMLAFNSNRLGVGAPQVFVMSASGGRPDRLSPTVGGYFSAPDWSPFGDRVAFHGRVGRSGRYHILVARMGEGRRLTQLTQEGNNEDPSWAPDGRHIVFQGARDWGQGLFVVDGATGRIRTLMRGVEVDTPDWSPALGG